MRWVVYVERTGEVTNAYKIFVYITRHRWDYTLRMSLKQVRKLWN